MSLLTSPETIHSSYEGLKLDIGAVPADAPSGAGVPRVGLCLPAGPGRVPPLSRASYPTGMELLRERCGLWEKLMAATDIRES